MEQSSALCSRNNQTLQCPKDNLNCSITNSDFSLDVDLLSLLFIRFIFTIIYFYDVISNRRTVWKCPSNDCHHSNVLSFRTRKTLTQVS